MGPSVCYVFREFRAMEAFKRILLKMHIFEGISLGVLSIATIATW